MVHRSRFSAHSYLEHHRLQMPHHRCAPVVMIAVQIKPEPGYKL